jgi:hypothetical protein
MGALLLAEGLGGKIAAIDTENGSLPLFSHVTKFDVQALQPPYTPERYVGMIHEAEKAGYDTIIIDSLSHEWSGVGGLLEDHGKMPGNSWANWRTITPRHQALINAMLASPCHIIATMRSKAEYIQTVKDGKTEIRKAGTAPQQRDGMDYEFTTVFNLSQEHIASTDKDRTGLFDGRNDRIVPEWGRTLAEWLDSGKAVTPAEKVADSPPISRARVASIHTAATSKGLTKTAFINLLQARFPVNETADLTSGQAVKLTEEMAGLTTEEVEEWNTAASGASDEAADEKAFDEPESEVATDRMFAAE